MEAGVGSLTKSGTPALLLEGLRMLTGLPDSLGCLLQPLQNLAHVRSHLPMLGQACIQLLLIIIVPLGKESPMNSASKGD